MMEIREDKSERSECKTVRYAQEGRVNRGSASKTEEHHARTPGRRISNEVASSCVSRLTKSMIEVMDNHRHAASFLSGSEAFF